MRPKLQKSKMTFRLQSALKLAGRIIPQNLVLGDNARGYRNSLPDNFLDLFVH